MSNKGDGKLNINCEQPNIEDQLAELKKRIISKLTEGYGYELQDDTLSTWIIVIAVRNNKSKGEVQQELEEFISENAEDFTKWLWNEVPKICTPPVPEQSVMQDFIDDKKESKPKVKSAVVVKGAPTTKSNQQNRSKKSDNSINLVKKAIGDTQKGAVTSAQNTGKKESTLLVKKNEDGRKVITLSKNRKSEENKSEEIEISLNKQEQETQKKDNSSSSNILDRLKIKQKESGESQGKCNLDMDLDSVIKKQKENERAQKDSYVQNRKRHHNEMQRSYYRKENESKPQVEEVDISESAEGNQPRLISLSQKNNNLRSLKRPKIEEGENQENEEAELEEKQEESELEKGKHKKNPYYQGMGYVPPYYMYQYPMYGMDPYMMDPYMYKPKKNKTWVKKTNEEYSMFDVLNCNFLCFINQNLIIFFC